MSQAVNESAAEQSPAAVPVPAPATTVGPGSADPGSVESGSASAAPVRRSVEQVRQDVAEVLYEPADEIGDDEDLLDRGLDSIRLMSLVERWRRLGAEISFVELAEHPSVRGLSELLDRKLARR